MIAKYEQAGCAIDYTPTIDVAQGDVIVQGDLIGIVLRDIKANELGALAVEGTFDLPKAVGVGTQIPAGSRVFWDAGVQQATVNDAGGTNKYIGKSVLDALDNDGGVKVRLSQ